jgi:hypothetical protein
MAAGRSVLQLLMAASFVGCGLAFRLHVSPLPAGMPRLGGARSRGVKRIHWKFTLPPTAALGGNGVSSTFGAATKATGCLPFSNVDDLVLFLSTSSG